MNRKASDILMAIGIILFIAALIVLANSYESVNRMKQNGRSIPVASINDCYPVTPVQYNGNKTDIGRHLTELIRIMHKAGKDVENEVKALIIHVHKRQISFESLGISKKYLLDALGDGWLNKAMKILEDARKKCASCDIEKEIGEITILSQKLIRLDIPLKAIGTDADELFDLLLEGYYREATNWLSMSINGQEPAFKELYHQIGMKYVKKFYDTLEIRQKANSLKEIPCPEIPLLHKTLHRTRSIS